MLVCIVALFSVSMSSCHKVIMEEKYDWSGTLSAPQEYPIEVYKGSLSAEGFTQNFRNWGVVNPGWGEVGGTVVIGPDAKAVPDSLDITWLSLVENKFYTGRFALPKEKMSKLFKEGFTNDQNKKDTYKNIIVGLAPEGTIVIWLMAAGKEVEVAKFKAHEANIDPTTVAADDKYMFKKGYPESVLSDPMVFKPEIKERINKIGYPEANVYDELYRTKFNWKPAAELVQDAELQNFGFVMYNGEMDKLAGESLKNNDYRERAIPKSFNVHWVTEDEAQHGIRITSFDEKEIFAAFKSIGSSPAELLLKVINENTVWIGLKTDNKEIELKNAIVKAY